MSAPRCGLLQERADPCGGLRGREPGRQVDPEAPVELQRPRNGCCPPLVVQKDLRLGRSVGPEPLGAGGEVPAPIEDGLHPVALQQGVPLGQLGGLAGSEGPL